MKAKAKVEEDERRRREAARVAANRQREEEWDRNMKEQQRLRDAMAGHGVDQQPPAARQAAPTPDFSEQARIFREARREAEANRLRALVDERPQPQPFAVAEPPPLVPAVPVAGAQGGGPNAPRKPLTAEEMEAARREAFWQMRREAEENKRKLMGLDPSPSRLPPPPAPAPAYQPAPQSVVNAPRPTPPAVHVPSSIPVVAAAPRGAAIGAAVAPPAVRAPSISDSDDEDVGLHRFLNNDAAAVCDEGATREVDYRGVGDAIATALAAGPTAGEDFDDTAATEDDSDPGKFIMEGTTLRLPNVSAADPLGHRIESLRLFLEHSLGDDRFIAVYRILDAVDDLTGVEADDGQLKAYSMLSKDQHKYVPVIMQLIVCEQAFMRRANFA